MSTIGTAQPTPVHKRPCPVSAAGSSLNLCRRRCKTYPPRKHNTTHNSSHRYISKSQRKRMSGELVFVEAGQFATLYMPRTWMSLGTYGDK
ncbi:hypothetical protein LINGRAHAP2_LOCUS36182 [Linum grandiflorum]